MSEIRKDSKEDKTLTNMIKDITFHYIKFFYEKELENRKVNRLNDEDVKLLVNNLYSSKSDSLKKYIRDTLKENLGDKYPKLQVNMILLEMFEDVDYGIQRVITEIINYQNLKFDNK